MIAVCSFVASFSLISTKISEKHDAIAYYMYRQLNIQQFYVLSTQCIYVFCVDLRTNSDYFPIQH